MNMPTTIWCDNSGSIQLTYNPVHHKRTKHIEVGFHLVRGKVNSNEIVIDKIHTSKMIADVWTINVRAKTYELLGERLMGSRKRLRITQSKCIRRSNKINFDTQGFKLLSFNQRSFKFEVLFLQIYIFIEGVY